VRKNSKRQIRSPLPDPTCFRPPTGLVFSAGDLERAFSALDQLFQDQDMPEREIRFRQSKLVEGLRERGISRALATALIQELLTLGVFSEGKSFLNLDIFVRFDGIQEDHATPDRYLLTTAQRWWRYAAQRRAAGAKSVLASNGKQSSRRQASRARNLERRDRWIYYQCFKPLTYKKIMAELDGHCRSKNWPRISSVQGIRAAAQSYAERHGLRKPPRRQDL